MTEDLLRPSGRSTAGLGVSDFVWGLSPWLAFLVVDPLVPFGFAVGVGLAVAAVVLVRARTRRGAHLLEVAAFGYFVALGAALLIARPDDADDWSRWAQVGSYAFVTLLVFGSLAVGHPFTEPYARETTPSRYWNTKRFRMTNTRISAAWGAAFLVGTVSLVLAAAGAPPLVFRAVIPFGALLVAFRYSRRQQQLARSSGAVATSRR